MWLLVYVPAVLGILRHRHWAYWRWVAAIVLWQTAAQFLFASYGSPDEPERNGLVTQMLYDRYGDSFEIAIVSLVFLVVFWGGIVVFLRKLYAAAKTTGEGTNLSKPVPKVRKIAELAALTAVIGALLILNFRVLQNPPKAESAVAAAPSLEDTIDDIVRDSNAQGRQVLDDITVLVRAGRDGRTLTVDYEITDPGITRAMAADELERSKAQDCGQVTVGELLAQGAAFRKTYSFASGDPPLTIELKASECPR